MSRQERDRWNEKYERRPIGPRADPASWLVENLPAGRHGRALDLACGLGDNALYLRYQRWNVDAIDFSDVAIRRAKERAHTAGLSVSWIVADLDNFVLPTDRYDLITCFYYLQRGRMPEQIAHSLRPSGLLIYETFSHDQLTLPANHIKNPNHTLRPGELLGLFPSLRVRRYRDDVVGGRAVASLVAEKPTPC